MITKKGRGRPKAKPKIIPTEKDESIETDESFSFAEVHEIPDIDSRLSQFIAEKGFDDCEKKGSLYKFDHPVSGVKKSFICSYHSDLPDHEEVGLKFGSGRYVLMVSFPGYIDHKTNKAPMASFTFKIHKRFDKLSFEHNNPGQETMQGGTVQPGNNDAMAYMKEMMSMIMPLMTTMMMSQNKQVPMSSQMNGMYDLMGGMMKKSFSDQQNLISELGKKQLELDFGEDEDDMGTAEKVISFIAPHIDSIIDKFSGRQTIAKKTEQIATANMVRMLPEYGNLLKSKNDLNKVMSYLNQKGDKETIGRMVKALGLKASLKK